MPIPRHSAATHPFLSRGFRPFFLLGSLFAGLSIAAWVPIWEGRLAFASAFAPVDWHIHEMLFGYVPAIVAGFLLTAVPNWTGRLPLEGKPLLLLALAWFAGRIAVATSLFLPWWAVMGVDGSFLALLAAAIAREIVAGKNWRNLKVLLPLAVLLAANLTFHVEVHLYGISDASRRLGMSAAIVMVMVIGGRIIPSFTRNWLARREPGRMPASFDRLDQAGIAVSLAALAAWTLLPESEATAVLLSAAAAANLVRLSRWAGERAWSDSLVLVLHAAWAFIPAGFALAAMSILWPDAVPQAAAMHAMGGGVLGGMTLSVMVRATLGHSGRALSSGKAGNFVFACVFAAALSRICGALTGEMILIEVAGVLWSAAFLGFGVLFWPALTGARRA